MTFPIKAYHCQFLDRPVTLIGATSASKARSQYYRESGLDDIYDFGDAIIHIRVRRAKYLDLDLMDQNQELLDSVNRYYGTSFKVGNQCLANNIQGIIIGATRQYVEVMHGDKRFPYHPSDIIQIAEGGIGLNLITDSEGFTFDDEVICPYCHYKHEASHEFNLTEVKNIITCAECGKSFNAWMEVTVTYYAEHLEGSE